MGAFGAPMPGKKEAPAISPGVKRRGEADFDSRRSTPETKAAYAPARSMNGCVYGNLAQCDLPPIPPGRRRWRGSNPGGAPMTDIVTVLLAFLSTGESRDTEGRVGV